MPLLTFIKNLPLLRQLFDGVPGPWLAKFTYLWKLYHLLRGSYRRTLWQLHQRYGSLVQVGPNEFSLSGFDKRLEFVSHRERYIAPFSSAAFDSLTKNFVMINLLRKESLIRSCNSQLIELLHESSKTGQPVSVPNLLVRHAYEVLMATTTGAPAGFLDKTTDPVKINTALKNWKFHAVLHGSYLRFHPSIKSVLYRCGFRSLGIDQIDPQLEVTGRLATTDATDVTETDATDVTDTNVTDVTDTDATECLDSATESHIPPSDLESRIAMSLAGADPVATLMSKALEHIYGNPVLLRYLRQELVDAELSNRPSFRELVVKKPRMPLLHAVLSECRRTEALYTCGLAYVAPSPDGVRTDGASVPAGSVIVLEPISHLNPSDFSAPTSWDPTRWLSEAALDLKRFLPAYNIADRDQKIEDFQVLIASSILGQVLPSFQLSSDNFASSKVSLTEYGQAILAQASSAGGQEQPAATMPTQRYPPRLIDLETIEQCFGQEGARELLSRFDPSKEVLSGEPLMSYPVPDCRDRSRLERAFDSIYGRRLRRVWDKHTNIMQISLFTDVPKFINSRRDEQVVRQQPPECHGEVFEQKEGNSTKSDEKRKTQDIEILKQRLGGEIANLLLVRFNPSNKIVSGEPIISPPIAKMDREAVHSAIGRVFGDRLAHKTDHDTDRMHIGPAGSIPNFPSRSNGHNQDRRGARVAHRGRGAFNGRPSRNFDGNCGTQRSPPPQGINTIQSGNGDIGQAAPQPPVNAVWGEFAVKEHNRVSAFKSMESWSVQKKQIDEENEAAKKDAPPPSAPRFKETFKQMIRDNGKLTGPRKTIRTVTTYHDGSIEIADAAENKSPEAIAGVAADVPRVSKVVPPHLRKAHMEQEKARQKQEQSSTGWVAARLPLA